MKIKNLLKDYKCEILKILDDEFAIIKPLCEDGSIFKYAFILSFNEGNRICSMNWTPNFYDVWVKNQRDITYYIDLNDNHKEENHIQYKEKYKRLEKHREILLKFSNILM